MVGVIITGLPASGKTFYTEWLIDELVKQSRVYHVFGDAIAHCSYNCRYTEQELDMKYNTIEFQVGQAEKYSYEYVVIDDLFKRHNDFQRICALFDKLIVVYLRADVETLVERNAKRPKYHQLTIEKMHKYFEDYGSIIEPQQISLEIDVSKTSKRGAKSQIMKYILGTDNFKSGKNI